MDNTGIQNDQTVGVVGPDEFEAPYAEPTIHFVRAFSDYSIEVVFEEGVTKRVDARPLLSNHPMYRPLLADPYAFTKAYVVPGGVAWSDTIDVSAWYFWENGETVSCLFHDLISMRDATTEWGLHESTIRKAIAAGRFQENVDYKKYGKQWVLTRAAVSRVYGPPLAEIRPDLVYPKHVMLRAERNNKK